MYVFYIKYYLLDQIIPLNLYFNSEKEITALLFLSAQSPATDVANLSNSEDFVECNYSFRGNAILQCFCLCIEHYHFLYVV